MEGTDSSWPIEYATWAQQGKRRGHLLRRAHYCTCHMRAFGGEVHNLISEGNVSDWLLTAAEAPWENSMWLGFTSAVIIAVMIAQLRALFTNVFSLNYSDSKRSA